MGGEDEEAKNFRMVVAKDVSDCQEIAEGFRHLFITDGYKAVMDPGRGRSLAPVHPWHVHRVADYDRPGALPEKWERGGGIATGPKYRKVYLSVL